MVFLGWYPDEITLRYHDFHANEVRAYFPMGGGDARVQDAVLQALANNKIILGSNITHVVPWRQACDGYRKIIQRDPSILGMVIDWTAP